MEEQGVLKGKRILIVDDEPAVLESLAENTEEEIAGFYLKSLAHSYDPHSEYFTQSEYDSLLDRKSLNYQVSAGVKF